MKKILCMLMAVLLLVPAMAQAISVKDFCAEYNELNGKGFQANYELYEPNDNGVWFLVTPYAGSFLAVQYDPATAEKPEDCQIKTLFVRHKPRTSMGQFVSDASAAMAILYPDVDASTIADVIVSAMAHSWRLFGEEPSQPIAYNTETFGQIVYEETTEYDTLLVDAPEYITHASHE